VIALLRARDDESVVMSYSVCEGFPNPVVAGAAPPVEVDPDSGHEDARDAFYALPPAEQWSKCLAELRTGVNGLELKPNNWEEFRFMHCLSVQDLSADDREGRMREAVERMNASA
jgi:hypothetical protein